MMSNKLHNNNNKKTKPITSKRKSGRSRRTKTEDGK